MFYEEELSRRDVQHANELKSLKKELRDADAQHLSLNKEIMMIKDKLEKTRREGYRNWCKKKILKMCPFAIFCVFKKLINIVTPHSQKEREEFETDYKQKYERERVLLMEENKKLSSELDNVSIMLVSVYRIVPQTYPDTYSHLSHLAFHTSSSNYKILNSEVNFLLWEA